MKDAVLRMIDRQKDIEKELEGVKAEYLKLEADVLVNDIQEVAGHRLLSRVYDERPVKELQGLAQQITARNDDVVVLFAVKNGSKLQLVGARGKASTAGLRESVRPVFGLINGKGGGKDAFVQGGGEAIISKEELMEEWIRQL